MKLFSEQVNELSKVIEGCLYYEICKELKRNGVEIINDLDEEIGRRLEDRSSQIQGT